MPSKTATQLPEFVISFDDVEGEIVFTIREEQHRERSVFYATTLMDAQLWTMHPHCIFTAVHDGFGDELVVETCDRQIAAMIHTHSEQMAAFDPESNGNDVWYLCDGHAAELRIEIAERGAEHGESITEDIEVTYQPKSPHLA